MQKTSRGFTIVELLIVIVVIAILAAISIVAYNGIQNRANDTIVQADLRNIGAKLQEYKVINNHYPLNGSEFASIGVRVTKGSYQTSNVNNFIYCTNNGTDFGIGALSKSGNRFKYTSSSGASAYSEVWSSGSGEACPNVLVTSHSWFFWGYVYASDTWSSSI